MKKCWDSNSDNRPNARELEKSIGSFANIFYLNDGDEIVKQFKEAYEYKRAKLLLIENNQLATHPQAIYTSRLLNPYTTGLIKIDWRESKDDQ